MCIDSRYLDLKGRSHVVALGPKYILHKYMDPQRTFLAMATDVRIYRILSVRPLNPHNYIHDQVLVRCKHTFVVGFALQARGRGDGDDRVDVAHAHAGRRNAWPFTEGV